MAIQVKNIIYRGSNARSISGSWLDSWEVQTERKASKCLAYDENAVKTEAKYIFMKAQKVLLEAM